MISVSIIIPAWNESMTLKPTIDSLLGIDYNKKKCEVIVVAGGDDNSYAIATDLSPSEENFSRYIVLLQGPNGKNAAIQQGIKEARNNVIVLLDADTMVSKRWLKELVSPIELGMCDLTIANPEPVRKSWVSDYYMVTKTYLYDSITTYSGHSMAFRASTVRYRLEYFFDEDIKVGVDYLLTRKFLDQGQHIMFVKDASVMTHLPSSFKYFLLTELRWLTALININGVSYRALACHAAVVAAMILIIPLSKALFIFSLLFHVLYMMKRTRMFLMVSRQCNSRIRDLFGFIILSYAYHVVGFISYIKYFSGSSKKGCLYQGQRY